MWTYDEALEYLYGFINYEIRREVRYAPEVMSLERPLRLLEAAGNPHRQYPIIHITGTKGKGSVGAYCLAALRSAGQRAGLYSSPHLQDFRERFRINDDLIPRETFAAILADLKPVIDQMPDLTWFEITTALAMLYFARERVDAVVLEVGLGGRLDATNIVTPLVSVITSLSYDHTHLLGNTLAQIAGEKAGIIKPGVPVVSAPQEQEAAEVLERVAAERGSPLIVVGRDWQVTAGLSTIQGQEFQAGPAGAMRSYWTPLIGPHQAINGAVALAALDQARRGGLDLPASLVSDGRLEADWPGRFEIVNGDPPMVLDAAHNEASAICLREALDEVFPTRRGRALVFGASADKDVAGMFRSLLPAIDHLVLAQAEHPRALPADELAAQAKAAGFTGTVEEMPVVGEALSRARDLAGSEGLVVVTGSLFIVGEVRDILGLRPGHAVNRLAGEQQVVREPAVHPEHWPAQGKSTQVP